jgi:hypothetical protein
MMTTAQVKQYLGIPTGTTTYDTDIARYIPIVEATANRITAGMYILQVNGTTTAASKDVAVSSVYCQSGMCLFGASKPECGCGYPYGDPNYAFGSSRPSFKPLGAVLTPGQLITGTGMAEGAFIESVSQFDGENKITLSVAATASGEVSLYTGFPVGYLSTIAHGVWFMIGQQKTAMGDTSWTSRTVGPVSETRSASEMKIDGLYGMPAWFVKAFPRVYQ